jgi:hypothetical protein
MLRRITFFAFYGLWSVLGCVLKPRFCDDHKSTANRGFKLLLNKSILEMSGKDPLEKLQAFKEGHVGVSFLFV